MPLNTPLDGAQSESALLLTRRGRSRQMSKTTKTTVTFLLIMKLCSNMYEYQMISFDVKSYNQTAAEAGLCIYQKQTPNSLINIKILPLATAAFVLPTLGGLMSDAFVGCIKTLWIAAVLQLSGSGLLTTFESAGMSCRMPLYVMSWLPFVLFMGIVSSLALHAPMQIASSSRARQLVLCLYFAVAAIGETLGTMPSMLKYLTEKSFEFSSVIFSIVSVLCLTMVTLWNKTPELEQENVQYFMLPSGRRLKKFYLISAGTIPHLACILLCRVNFYWQQIRFFARTHGVDDYWAFFVPFAGYQTATTLFSLLGASAIYKFGTPAGCINLMTRIRAGLCLMTASKVSLMLLSLLDFYNAINIESWSSSTVWAIYFASAFCDGITTVLTTIAIYEIVYRVANSGAKATMLGIFYTVWGLSVFLNGLVLLTLQACNVLSLDPSNRTKPMSHYAYGCVICLLLIAIAYWEKISWPLASSLLADQEAQELESSEHERSSPA